MYLVVIKERPVSVEAVEVPTPFCIFLRIAPSSLEGPVSVAHQCQYIFESCFYACLPELSLKIRPNLDFLKPTSC